MQCGNFLRLHQISSILKGKLWIPADHRVDLGRELKLRRKGRTHRNPAINHLACSVISTTQSSAYILFISTSYTAKGVCVYVCTLYVCTHSFPVSVCKVNKLKIARDGSTYSPIFNVGGWKCWKQSFCVVCVCPWTIWEALGV